MGLFIPRLEKLIHRLVSTPGVHHTVGQDASGVRGEVIETPNGLQTSPPTLGQLGKAGMLVLTRKKNESIIINDVIKVTVIEIRGDKVRLGIEAPRKIDVHRQEVYEQIHGKHLANSRTADSPSQPIDAEAAREAAENEAENNRRDTELPPPG